MGGEMRQTSMSKSATLEEIYSRRGGRSINDIAVRYSGFAFAKLLIHHFVFLKLYVFLVDDRLINIDSLDEIAPCLTHTMDWFTYAT